MTETSHRKRWRLLPQDADRARALAAELQTPPAVGQLLLNRGVATPSDGRRFLDRRLTQLADPRDLAGVTEAADLLHAAVKDGRKICIYGDYDVDGMCSTAILLECLRLAGAKPTFYVPDRLEEGYGVNAGALEKLRADGVDVVVTVDCGVASLAEAARAKEIGLTYIVTDHHRTAEDWPVADAVVHPRRPGSTPISADLCGAGVAYKIAWELGRRISGGERTTDEFRRFLLDATALAAIATVCDVAPLAGENRVLVHHGLAALTREPPLGLRTLVRHSGLADKRKLSAGDVGFTLGPRLNASGRLGTARLGVEILTTRDPERALKLAEYLEEQNKQRQLLERRMLQHARELAEERYGFANGRDTSAIVLADDYAADRWHPGVLGIVAGRMVERYHRPCILLAFTGEAGSGSGRSVSGFDLHAGVTACTEHLVGAGGHAMAVGVRCSREKFDEFRTAFEAAAERAIPAETRRGELRLDAEVALAMLTPGLLQALEVLEPFGLGNPAPVFFVGGLKVVGEPRKVGNGERHLSFTVQAASGGPVRKAIGFDMADRLGELMSQEGACCLAFTPHANEFRGQTSVDLRLRDLQAGPTLQNDLPSEQRA